MSNKPLLSGWGWRVALAVALILLGIVMVYTCVLLLTTSVGVA